MWILIASEATLFAAFIGAYYYLRFEHGAWPPPGTPAPDLLAPIVLTAVLVLTAIPLQLASAAARAGAAGRTWLLVLAALVVQAGYLAYSIHDFADQLRETPIDRNAYTSAYYTLLGADHAHVAIGLLFDLWVLVRVARGLTRYRVNTMRAVAWYWYFVVVLTVVVTGVLLSARA
jgi:heme/copper-type cytochrome/quinol oxidase subunit 3